MGDRAVSKTGVSGLGDERVKALVIGGLADGQWLEISRSTRALKYESPNKHPEDDRVFSCVYRHFRFFLFEQSFHFLISPEMTEAKVLQLLCETYVSSRNSAMASKA